MTIPKTLTTIATLTVFTSSLTFFTPIKTTPFFQSVLHSNALALQRIKKHPFNKRLLDGTLPQETFGYYLRDDYFYLSRYGQILQKLAVRAYPENPTLARQLDYIGKGIISGEQEMQLQYSQYLKVPSHHIPSPLIKRYTQFLEHTTEEAPLPTALISILPCFWAYYEIGLLAKPATLNNNPYKAWINTYRDPKFVKATLDLANTVDILGNTASPTLKLKMNDTFQRALKFEGLFFDEVWRKEHASLNHPHPQPLTRQR